MPAPTSSVDIAHDGAVAVVTMCGTPDGNAADPALHDALLAAFAQIARDEHVRAIVLTGTARDFCSGRAVLAPPGQNAMAIHADLANNIIRLNQAIRNARVPTVAAVEGRALSFGCGLAVACDLTVAAANARFGFPELQRDLPPLIVTSFLGRLVGRKRAAHMILTGIEVDGTEACRIGLAGEVVAPGLARDAALERARSLAARDPLAVALVRDFLKRAEADDEASAAEAGIAMMATVLSSRAATKG